MQVSTRTRKRCWCPLGLQKDKEKKLVFLRSTKDDTNQVSRIRK